MNILEGGRVAFKEINVSATHHTGGSQKLLLRDAGWASTKHVANHSAAFDGSVLSIPQELSLQLNYFLIFPSNLLLPSVRLFLDP